MKDTTYNGWTNYATWRVNLEIFDGIAWLDQFDDGIDLYDAANILKKYAETIILDYKTEATLAEGFALAFMSNVNWREIAQRMIDAYVDA